ncbi:SDR family oxidoreductase [Chelatococcus asaccharovorans]|uniref:SDR family oxidoreductase n=1 Tax=Chelatococcus asaccharovorans TaxID=28210 RepID=UPI00224C768A|nr:SDR family NAD(P)-dependent oxidoreductase [Chelatococcus asaccharovorans]CAH1664709.1 SDR family oxidoreductase [Chelatococcus asaccharovorans]CAH1682272.1 SDR family oxidoreductase [Chelatococcus asaccharovorans]
MKKVNATATPSPRVAVITGASGGIGSAIAHTLFSSGYRLVLTSRSKRRLAEFGTVMGESAKLVSLDITGSGSAERLLATALDIYGRCDVCVISSGILETGSIDQIDIDRVAQMARVNVEASFRIAHVFARYFAGQNAGHLINISSVLGTKVRMTAGAYAGTKAAIEFLLEALRMELAHSDVKITSVRPGLVKTHLHDHWETPPEIEFRIPEPLSPDDVAQAVVFALKQPRHVRIPEVMILPAGHVI